MPIARLAAAQAALNDKEKRVRELLMQSVYDELDLSARTWNCLRSINVESIGDLVRLKEWELLKLRNFGRKSLQELVHMLNEKGLHFGMGDEKKA